MAIVPTSSMITLIRGRIHDLAQSDGQNIFKYDNDSSFKLSEAYVDSTSIKVFKNGTELLTGWSYNSSTNRVTISASLTKNDSIIITFSYYAKYSDTEIIGYLKSALMHFVQKQYKKTFYVNSNNEVVTLNGINPTEEEANIIALITAIEIDPQNVNVNIQGTFTVSATEKLSKTEQIDRVFDRFLRNFGTIDFMEID